MWPYLLEPDLLTQWLADEVVLDPRPGGEARFRVEDEQRTGWVEEVAAPDRPREERRLVFWWNAEGEPASRVVVTVDPLENRQTCVRIVETRPLEILDVDRLAAAGASQRGSAAPRWSQSAHDRRPGRRGLRRARRARPPRAFAVDCAHPATATELAEGLPISRQAVTKHLASLSDAGLLERERAGRDVRYRLTPEPLSDAMPWMVAVGGQWDERLERLRSVINDGTRAGAEPPVSDAT